MSRKEIEKPVTVLVCDLCGLEIENGRALLDTASLIVGYGDLRSVTQKSTHRSYLRWPSDRKVREGSGYANAPKQRNLDFHGKCITELVEREMARLAVLNIE